MTPVGRVSTVLDRDRSNKPGLRTRTEVFLAFRTMVPKKWHFTSFLFIKWWNLKLNYNLIIKIQVKPTIFWASWYILRKLHLSEITLLGPEDLCANFWLAVAPKLDEIQSLSSKYILQICILAMHHPKNSFPAPLAWVHGRVPRKTSKTLRVFEYGQFCSHLWLKFQVKLQDWWDASCD